ncbi:zona pellucida sperm-binding protein 3-like [Anabas testudineus]|uniref:Zona pellucida sperm-binding protein 3 n=1 Tax=Anabas testudineus TaxID=64144 RepID=A0A3Q1IF96_ANATE|nr:zona pellucida sperm-binding protein 3-like [Anabas testudineus]
MGRKLLRASVWWIIGLISLFSQSLSRTEVQPEEPSARPVVVRCHPDSMEVVVQADMFSTGLKVDGRHLRLGSDLVGGGSACGALPSGEDQFTVRAPLMECGTQLSSTREKIIYSNVLVYSPEPSSDGVLRLDGARVPVECHYEKRYAVNGISVRPTWIPFVSRASAGDQINFNLRLMADDWQLERGSHAYFLGYPVNFEASAIMVNHAPLQVYVDHCVATTTPDAEAILRYDFIDNYGCLADAYLTNSSSHFLPRVEEHMLRFQLDAFRFYREPSNQVYITCYMKAVPVNLTVSSQNKACSLIEKRWRSVDGHHQTCRSCGISYQVEGPLFTEPPTTTTMITEASSTITTHEKPEQHPARYIRFRPKMRQSQYNDPNQSSGKLVKRGDDYKAERTMQLGPHIVLASSEFVSGPTDSKSRLSPKAKIT